MGALTGGVLTGWSQLEMPYSKPVILAGCLILLLPFVWDGYQSYFGSGTVNWKRFATGVLAGGALSVLLGIVL